ncbi:hypothetical protein OnM2_032007 [Erysiphe neolycopersici]|uniref:Uncharacterized protein n=1 Tax=Erysiphe neolycopersici TaxID=212602 RepID=A0A420HYV6_9PEZI|nr:hypothetical protein OnM2_032007 [Erysiphe neolycopersici]
MDIGSTVVKAVTSNSIQTNIPYCVHGVNRVTTYLPCTVSTQTRSGIYRHRLQSYNTNNPQNCPKNTTHQNYLSQNPKDRSLALKNKRQNKPRTSKVHERSQHKNRIFVTNHGSSNEDDTTRSGVERLEDDQAESELENFPQECLEQEDD